jgi:hypothetical protein
VANVPGGRSLDSTHHYVNLIFNQQKEINKIKQKYECGAE